MAPQRLILFDIDGTLARSNQVGSRSLRRALADTVGRPEALDGVELAGQCDWGILRAALRNVGHDEATSEALIPTLLRAHVAALRATLADPAAPKPERLPGVLPLLRALAARRDVLLGLLTGNAQEAAWLKLGHVGLDGFFTFGAFGDEAAVRAALPPLAVARAEAQSGQRFRGRHIVVVGDTPDDVRCGDALGVATVAVATGRSRADALHAAGADVVFDDFSQPSAVLAALLGPDPEGATWQR